MDDHTLHNADNDDEEVLNELLEQEHGGANSQTSDVLSASTPYPKPTKPTSTAANVSKVLEVHVLAIDM